MKGKKVDKVIDALKKCRDTLVLCQLIDKSGQAAESVALADKVLASLPKGDKE